MDSRLRLPWTRAKHDVASSHVNEAFVWKGTLAVTSGIRNYSMLPTSKSWRLIFGR